MKNETVLDLNKIAKPHVEAITSTTRGVVLAFVLLLLGAGLFLFGVATSWEVMKNLGLIGFLFGQFAFLLQFAYIAHNRGVLEGMEKSGEAMVGALGELNKKIKESTEADGGSSDGLIKSPLQVRKF